MNTEQQITSDEEADSIQQEKENNIYNSLNGLFQEVYGDKLNELFKKAYGDKNFFV